MTISISAVQKKVVEVMRTLILVFSFLILANAVNAETLLQCKFKWGDKVTPGVRTLIDARFMEDIYLKIDFEKKKSIESPFNIFGPFGSNTKVVFTISEVKWFGENKYIRKSATLDRQTGNLQIINNSLERTESGEENYLCTKGKLKF
jgi:hypothetical protein